MAKKAIKQTVHIKTSEENPEPMELVAQSIIDISNAFTKIADSRLRQRALVLLLHDMTGVNMGHIKQILEAAPKLKDWYTKELKKAGK